MWTLKRAFSFEAAHYLPNHDGKCSRLHGHNWKVWIMLESPALVGRGPSTGMVIDFYDLWRVVNETVGTLLDHRALNDVPGLENPTSENIAKWIYDRLLPVLSWTEPDRQLRYPLELLAAIEVEETPGCSVTYRP
jgi:6-pyruvoyltetrahydropterin/6-carboxytetrahydropterin synthase